MRCLLCTQGAESSCVRLFCTRGAASPTGLLGTGSSEQLRVCYAHAARVPGTYSARPRGRCLLNLFLLATALAVDAGPGSPLRMWQLGWGGGHFSHAARIQCAHSVYMGGGGWTGKTFSVTKQRVVAAADKSRDCAARARCRPPHPPVRPGSGPPWISMVLAALPRPSQQGVESSSPLLTPCGPSPGPWLFSALPCFPGGLSGRHTVLQERDLCLFSSSTPLVPPPPRSVPWT